MQKTIIYLIGYPGVGKKSIAHAMSASDPALITIDNHMVSNLLRYVAGHKEDDLRTEITQTGTQLSRIILDFIASNCEQNNYVLSSVLYENDIIRKDWYDTIHTWAQTNQWRLVPVTLECDLFEAQRRIISEERTQHGKLTDPNILAELYEKYTLLRPKGKEGHRLDITNLSVTDAANIIFKFVKNSE